MKQIFRKFFLIISLFCGGYIFYEQITVGFDFNSIYTYFFFFISSLFAILIPSRSNIQYVYEYLISTVIWITSIALVFGSISIIQKLQDLSPILFSTKFHFEEGLNIEFRKNGTYKALYYHLLGGDLSYGKFILQDSLILIKDELKFGGTRMNDTLVVSNKGIFFSLEKLERISEGSMLYEYTPKTELVIENNTDTKIDSISIKLSYTKEFVNLLSLKPGNKSKYKFDLKNPHVNGRYILTYKFKDQSNSFTEIRNILNGYPLETVKTIQFEDSNIEIELIFGNTIRKKYI